MSSYVRKYVSLKEDFYIKDSLFQKQPLTDSLQNRCSEKFCKFHRKIPVLESLQALAYNFIKKRLLHSCFPVEFARYLRTPFFTELLRWLFLSILLCPFSNFGAFFIHSYITVTFYSILLVWRTFLPRYWVIPVFKVVSLNSCHIYQLVL